MLRDRKQLPFFCNGFTCCENTFLLRATLATRFAFVLGGKKCTEHVINRHFLNFSLSPPICHRPHHSSDPDKGHKPHLCTANINVVKLQLIESKYTPQLCKIPWKLNLFK